MLATNNGVELAVQQILRMDDTHLVIRGRLGGTTDANRIFMVPYVYLSFCYFTLPVSNERLKPVFGDLLADDAFEAVPQDHQALADVETQEVESAPVVDIAGDMPKIDVSTLQPQVRPATGPKSVAASLHERLLRTRGPRQ